MILEELLELLEEHCWDIRCIDLPTGGGDADVEWQIIEHHIAAPQERVIAFGTSLKEALKQAILRQTGKLLDG